MYAFVNAKASVNISCKGEVALMQKNSVRPLQPPPPPPLHAPESSLLVTCAPVALDTLSSWATILWEQQRAHSEHVHGHVLNSLCSQTGMARCSHKLHPRYDTRSDTLFTATSLYTNGGRHTYDVDVNSDVGAVNVRVTCRGAWRAKRVKHGWIAADRLEPDLSYTV
jgi:hypothetical protein